MPGTCLPDCPYSPISFQKGISCVITQVWNDICSNVTIRCVLLLYHCVRGCEIIGWPAGLIGYHGTQGGPRVSSPIVPSAFPSNLYKYGVFKGHI